MEHPESEIDGPLRDALRHGREVSVPGFAERAMVAVRGDARRRRVIRWVSLSAPLAGCAAALLLFLGGRTDGQLPSENELAQLVSLHDEVTLATPRLDDPDALVALVLADS